MDAYGVADMDTNLARSVEDTEASLDPSVVDNMVDNQDEVSYVEVEAHMSHHAAADAAAWAAAVRKEYLDSCCRILWQLLPCSERHRLPTIYYFQSLITIF